MMAVKLQQLSVEVSPNGKAFKQGGEISEPSADE